MKNLIQVFSLITENHDFRQFSFNANFLEANVFNILLLLFGLIYVLKQFLGSMLVLRQEKVLFAIQESEERLRQASLRLLESEKQLAQAQIVVNQIIQESTITADKVRQSILNQGKVDIDRLMMASRLTIVAAESQVKQQIQQQITHLALKKVVLQLQNQITPSMQIKIINSSIAQLGGHL